VKTNELFVVETDIRFSLTFKLESKYRRSLFVRFNEPPEITLIAFAKDLYDGVSKFAYMYLKVESMIE
jgi:hypothetical protein